MDTLKDQQWLETLHEEGSHSVAGVGSRPRRGSRARLCRLWMMLPLLLGPPGASPARVLAIGAHPDDIEIGCAGTILKLMEEGAVSEIRWVVLSGEGDRAQEARRSADALFEGVARGRRSRSVISRTASSPTRASASKDFFEGLKADFSPTWSSLTNAPTCTRITGSVASSPGTPSATT